MADISDVEVALASAVGAALYPGGTGQATAGGYPCRIARGEPNAEALNSDLNAGIINVTIRAIGKMARNTTRYFNDAQLGAAQPPVPLAVSMAGCVATFSGAGGAGAVAGVYASGAAYSHATVAGDTPASVAAALAALVPGATASGASLTLPATGGTPLAAVYGNAQVITELRRQEQGFAVMVSAHTPDARSAVAGVLDAALAAVDFLALADGSAGRLRYRSTEIDDVPSRANMWKRTLTYTVEFGTTATQTVTQAAFGVLTVGGTSAGVIA
jgi:hypothetical protein